MTDDYEYLFRESNAGSQHLTKAVTDALGAPKVAPAEDTAWGRICSGRNEHDLSDPETLKQKVKRVRSRDCLWKHWAPPCTTMSTLTAGRYYNRSQADPVGPETGDPAKDAKRDEHLRIAVNVCGLARLTHEMGDFFTIEAP